MTTALASKLPLTETFEAQYLEYNGILPLEVTREHLKVAIAGQPAIEVLDDLEISFGLPLDLVAVSRDELIQGIRQSFAAAESMVELVRDLDSAVGMVGES